MLFQLKVYMGQSLFFHFYFATGSDGIYVSIKVIKNMYGRALVQFQKYVYKV